MLRASEVSSPERIRHIPSILYHWRRDTRSPSYSEQHHAKCVAAARRAIAEHLRRTGIAARVEAAPGPTPGWSRVVYELPAEPPLVSVIVPTRDRAELLRRCVDGILANTAYSRIELLIVDNDSAEPDTLELLEDLAADSRVRILRHPGPFAFAAMNNHAVAEARGEIIVLMNDDVEVISPAWLEEMVVHALRPEVGAVGAKLLYPDGTVQHAGVVLGIGEIGGETGPGHFSYRSRRDEIGYFGFLVLTRRVSAVTGACMALRKSVYQEVNGMDDVNLAVAYSDVDLCLRLGEKGYAIVWTPHAELYHHEAASRGADVDGRRRARWEREVHYLRQRWGGQMDRDPFYNDNCAIGRANFEPGFPPRRQKPWLIAQPARDGVQLVASSSTPPPAATRAEQLLAPIDRSARILEIGPSYNPIAPRRAGWNTSVVDHATRSELATKYTGHEGVDVSMIEEVDFVWTSGLLTDAVPRELHGTYDALIASHVIEHTTDFVGFLSAAEALVSESGIVILAVPDKRYCFDYFRPATITGEVLDANAQRRSRHTRRIVFDQTAYCVKSGGNIAWAQAPVEALTFVHRLEDAWQAFTAVSDDPAAPYVDMHAWQFTPSSFELLLLELARLGKTDWQIQRITPAMGCEFHAWLRRGGAAAARALPPAELEARRLGLLKKCLLDTRAQIDFLIAANRLDIAA